jgi:putative spermidine/putrescine transport system permease protein
MTTIPLFTAMLWAFVDPQYGWSYREILPAHFALDNWRNIFMYTGIVQAIGASFGIAATTTVVCLILSLPTSYAISRINQKAKEACKVIMLVPLVLPGMVVAIFLSRILLMFGLSQNSLGIVLGHIFIAIPYMLRLLTVSFESVPDNLADAARNLGAGKLSVFVEIIVPSVLPGIAAGMLFSFIASMEEFNLAFIIGTPGIQTITTVLYSYLGQNLAKPSSSVVSLILVVPNIILMLVAERYIKTEHLGAALGKM